MYYIREADIARLQEIVTSTLASTTPSRCLVLIRGLPGMGKSYLAKLISQHFDAMHYETDQKFTMAGEYQFDSQKLMAAHEITKHDVKQSMTRSIPCIVVSNTFTQDWEYDAYLRLAQNYQYPVVIFDLLLLINQYIAESLPILQQTEASIEAARMSYLTYLATNNEHQVPEEKIHIMANRYQYSNDVLTVVPVKIVAEGELRQHKYFEVLDSGYYLALAINVAEDHHHEHSAIFWACIQACYELMRIFGIASSYSMIRKLINRNLKSHSSMFKDKENKSLVKMNAGWAKYHITILSPVEYKAMQESNQLEEFKSKLNELPLDELNEQFQYLLDAKREQCLMSASLCQQRLIDSIGMIQGEIVENQTTSASLDDFSTALLNAMANIEEKDSKMSFSSAFYLLLQPTSSNEVLEQIQQLRDSYDALNALGSVWNPHITLAFTHNDIHQPSSQFTAAGQMTPRVFGLKLFQQCRQKALAKRSNSFPTDIDEEISSTTQSSLEEDSAIYPFLAELFVHSEVEASFSTAFDFVICDVKIRKGLFGDDASYKAHPILLKLLPRGLVFLQYQPTSTMYRALFSLRKFYGKEGMEDDGFGMTAGELHFHLLHRMQLCSTLMLMEKVNGRAGSSRFFRFRGKHYVLVGTKLAHTIGKINQLEERIELSPAYQDEYQSFLRNMNSESSAAVNDLEEDEVEANEEDNSEQKATQYEKQKFYRNKLIISNVIALERSLQWSRFEDFYDWVQDQTINGEILDPQEMHLVVIDQLQWVHLCSTKFPVLDIDPFFAASQIKSETSQPTSISLLSTLELIQQYFKFLPSYQLHDLTHFDTASNYASTTNEEDSKKQICINKKIHVMNIAKSLIYERNSEGKVLYLLTKDGEVLDMMKYKTWWYIYRRSIRELISKLLSRYHKKIQEEHNAAGNGGKAKTSDNEVLLGKLKTQLQNMSKAKNKEHDKAFQAKLQQLRDTIEQIENPPVPETVKEKLALGLKPLVEELVGEVQRKWPHKFNFLVQELEDSYAGKVQSAISFATQFIQYFHQSVANNEELTLKKFRTQYPLMWEEFLLAIGKDATQDC